MSWYLDYDLTTVFENCFKTPEPLGCNGFGV